MILEIGHVEALFRYPVKSMAAERLNATNAGWHGLEGDRRLALRRCGNGSGFPWLSASSLPDLLLFTPVRSGASREHSLPTHVQTPEGDELPVFGNELAAEIGSRHGAPVEMTHLRGGVFDETPVSVISTDTIEAIGTMAGIDLDVRRFRPNIVVRLRHPAVFQEDTWIGGVLQFGDSESGPRIAVTMCDERCSMVNLDPDSGQSQPAVLRTIVRMHRNLAGVYGSVVHTGHLAVGQPIRLFTTPTT